MIDLPEDQLEVVRAIVAQHLSSAPVFAFGSRVTGKAVKFSDLDLMVKADARLPWLKLADLRESFEASTLPITVDVVDWATCSDGFKKLVGPQLQAL